MRKFLTPPRMILLASLILMSVSGCKAPPINHVPNEKSVYRFANNVKLPAYSVYFMNTNGAMEAVAEPFNVGANWRLTGPGGLPPKK